MATAISSFFLLFLLFFCVFSTITTTTIAQQTSMNSNNTIIPIDSFLTPTNNTNSSSSWLSQLGLFAFGFYPLQDGGFVVGVWYDGIPQKKVVIWTSPILVNKTDSNNFRLCLTRDQGLVLQSTQGQDQDRRISEITFGSTVSYASMLDTGNMVLYDSNSTLIWETFNLMARSHCS